MRKSIVKLSWVVVATALIIVGSISGARADAERIVARVPFAFIVGDARLPPGEYVVRELPANPDVMSIVSADGRRSTMTLTISAASEVPVRQPELTFEKFEGQYFLARIDSEDGSRREIALTPARMEHEIVVTALKP
jgi:hypothetical protein